MPSIKSMYAVHDLYGNNVYRPNRTSAGMTLTAARSGHRLNGDALRLSVRGTLDKLGGMRWGIKTRTITRYGINDTGRRRLKLLRARKEL